MPIMLLLLESNVLPEVATKLRVLLVRSKQNRPLLLEVAGQLGFTPIVTLGGPPIRRARARKVQVTTLALTSFLIAMLWG